MARQAAAEPRKAVAAKPRAAKKMERDEEYKCQECGLIVSIVDPCGCDEPCFVTCCSEPMVKTARARSPRKVAVAK